MFERGAKVRTKQKEGWGTLQVTGTVTCLAQESDEYVYVDFCNGFGPTRYLVDELEPVEQ